MIKRTAQEWADFTGEEIRIQNLTWSFEFEEKQDARWVQFFSPYLISDFNSYTFGDVIKPSEPHVLIPARLLEEASELIQRLNTALDGKIKEKEEKTDWMQKINDSGLFDLTDSYTVTNQKSGSALFCLSPLRDDKSVGSFSVNLNTGFWHDLATGANGSFDSLVSLKNLPE